MVVIGSWKGGERMIIGGIFFGIVDWWLGLFGDGDVDFKIVMKVL